MDLEIPVVPVSERVIMSAEDGYKIIEALGITGPVQKVEIILEARQPVQVKVKYCDWDSDAGKLATLLRKYCICNKP